MDKPPESASAASPQGSAAFPIVGIGASAGGFAALATLLQNMPPGPGMALVVVLHLPPGEPSTADKVLQRSTPMPVVQVAHTMPILPDKVYVIPPDRSLSIRDGRLVLGELVRNSGRPVAIDMFLRALAESWREKAIGVILSGMGSDGTAGLACIRAMGGVAIAQLPVDAEEGAMPRSAIESGMADFVLAATEIPRKLAELRDITAAIRRRGLQGASLDAPAPFDMGPQPQRAVAHVLELLRERTGHDFSDYRRATLLRRLERRLQVRGTPDLARYCRVLDKDAGEAHSLMKDLLIGVTSFFRDRAAFEALDRLVLPALFRPEREGQPLRAWVAACSTGQEAYSLAMLLADRAAATAVLRPLQIFASDIDEQALQVARRGMYPAAAGPNCRPPCCSAISRAKPTSTRHASSCASRSCSPSTIC